MNFLSPKKREELRLHGITPNSSRSRLEPNDPSPPTTPILNVLSPRKQDYRSNSLTPLNSNNGGSSHRLNGLNNSSSSHRLNGLLSPNDNNGSSHRLNGLANSSSSHRLNGITPNSSRSRLDIPESSTPLSRSRNGSRANSVGGGGGGGGEEEGGISIICNSSDGSRRGSGESASCGGKRGEAVAYAVTGLTGIYAMLLVSVYVSFTFTELVTFPRYQWYLEKNGFFVYLYAVSDVFLAYVLFFTARGDGVSKSTGENRVLENHRSHGSVTVRYGAIVFGLGNLIYFILEMISFTEVMETSPCYFKLLGANVGLSIIFVILQTYLIFVYPRLNLRIVPGLDSFGTMHLVATNIIMWIRTLVKESLVEIAESEELEKEDHLREAEEHEHTEVVLEAKNCNFFSDRILEYEKQRQECQKHRNDMLGDALINSSPYLYPFVIEYALIGASVLLLMWMHVGKLPKAPRHNSLVGPIRKPRPVEFIKKGDWSHTLKGTLAGMVIFALAILNLGLFFGMEGRHKNIGDSEFYSKLVNTITNLLGILALVVGLGHIQLLANKNESGRRRMDSDDDDEEMSASDQLDLTLLRFTAFFSYLYHNFTVITGSFNTHIHDFPDALHIVNGVVEAAQITLQLIFLSELKKKMMPEGENFGKPGRQVTIFLFLYNLAQWIVITFEIQKVRASLVEASFYGFMPWVIIQRVTLPLTVFFRFHSAVVSIELWKEIYWE